MKFFVLFFLFFASALSSDVLEFDDGDFSDKIGDHETILVEFYAPWCGHCKKLAPEYEKAASSLVNNDPPVPLAKVDCIANADTCKKFGVSGYPTLKIFRDGEFSADYQGPREADGIVKYMKNQVGTATRELNNIEDFNKFIGDFDAGIVGFFDSESSKLFTSFKKVSEAMREDFRFAHTFSSEVAKDAGDYSENIVLYRPKRLANKFEDDKVKYTDDDSVYKVKQFIKNNLHGLVGHRTNSNQKDFSPPLLTAFYEVDYVKNSKGSNYWRNRIMKVASQHADKDLKFAVCSNAEFVEELHEFGLKFIEKPVVAIRNANGEKFPMKEEFSLQNLENFVKKYFDGKLTPYLKSEDVPTSQDQPVKVVVAKNFDEIVNDDSKDVLVEFYAPWCGHCKNLAPKYDELAEKLKDETDVVIAKMDATANDVPSNYKVAGFPTLYWAPKGGKNNPKKYDSGREVDDFVNFIAKHSTDELKGWDRKGKKKKTEL